MFQHAVGDTVWKKGLFNYLVARGYDYGTPDYLHQNLQKAVDEANLTHEINVAMMMGGWEAQSGFPYVTVKRSGLSLTLEQNQFTYENKVVSKSLWWIPINLVVGSNPDFRETKLDFWIPGTRSMTIQGLSHSKPFTSKDWIILNIQQTGFYRVNYDKALWKLISDQLNKDFEKIHVLNRAQLIDDSFNLARAGLINFDVFLTIINYLDMESDYIPWASLTRADNFMNKWLMRSKVYANYQAFMRKNVALLMNRLGMEIIDDEPRVDR